MQQEIFEEQVEILPNKTAEEFVKIQKENYPYPLHQSGLQLMSSIANITACAMLINEEHLNYNPSIFEELSFEQERKNLQNLDEKEREQALDYLTLRLTKEYREELEKDIDNFFVNYMDHFDNQANLERGTNLKTKSFKFSKETGIKNTFYIRKSSNGELVNCRREAEGLFLEEKTEELVKDEIEMKKVFIIYKKIANFLKEQGIPAKTFEKMLKLTIRSNRKKHTTH